MRCAGGVGCGNVRSGAARKPTETDAGTGISAKESRSRSTAGAKGTVEANASGAEAKRPAESQRRWKALIAYSSRRKARRKYEVSAERLWMKCTIYCAESPRSNSCQ